MTTTPQGSTPGPWEVRPSSKKGNGTGWRDIVSMEGPFAPSYVGEALECDASLIASAPTMRARIAALESRERELVGALEAVFLDLGRRGGNTASSPLRPSWELARSLLAPASAEVEG